MAAPEAADFAARRVLVTGAAAGIGEAIARRLARSGALVACADLDEAGASAVAAAIIDQGGRALPLGGDVSEEEDVARMIDATARAFGGLDVLVNNAGIVIIKPLEETSIEEWDRTLGVNLRSMFLTCRGAIPLLRASGHGAIVNVASMAALRFTVPHVAYASSKGGVVSFTRDLAVELGPDGIRVNAVAPGPIATGILGALDDERIASAGMRFLLGRMGRPADVAEAVAFLASDRASYITGATLPVTGGAELATRPLRREEAELDD
jgi:NAD(P)-dependent dehydrogenase (short-subunit alcohol dehydrogenase family)